MVGRLHWVTDVTPLSFVEGVGARGRKMKMMKQMARSDNIVSGDIVGEHSGVRVADAHGGDDLD